MSFIKQQILKMIIGAALVMAVAIPASAQQQLKIGFVNLPVLIQASPHWKAASATLQEEFAPRERELLAKQKELEDLTTKAQKDVAVMGETERRNMEKELRDLQRDALRLQEEFREDANLRQNEEMSQVQSALAQEVRTYATDQGYDLIVVDGILHVSSAIDITEAVLRAVEANFQATSATQ